MHRRSPQTNSTASTRAVPIILALAGFVLACSTPVRAETAAGGADAPASDPRPPSRTAALVGGEPITYEELLKTAAKEPQFLRKLARPQGKAQVLESMIAAKLLELVAREEGLLEPDGSGDRMVAFTELRKRHFPPVEPPSESVVRAFYETNLLMFGIPEMVRVTRIQFAAPGEGPEREAVLARAQAILTKLREGTDPATLDLGPDVEAFTPPKFFPPEVVAWFPAALEGVAVGEYTEVVAMDTGFEIIRLLKRQPALMEPYDQVRDSVARNLQRQEQDRRRKTYMGELAQRYGVEITDPAVAAFFSFSPDESHDRP